MSRFFRDTESADSSSDYSSSEDEKAPNKPIDSDSDSDDDDRSHDGGATGASGPSKFMRAYAADSDSEEEEDTKRVVKSAKDKKFDEMLNAIKGLKNALKIKDWIAIQTDFDKLNKALTKANAIVQRDGIPGFYFSALSEVDDAIKEQSAMKDAKKMNPSTSRAFNAMKQKMKKQNKLYESEIEAWKANPEQDGEADVDEGSDTDRKKSKKTSQSRAEKEEQADEDGDAGDEGDFQLIGKGGKVFDAKPENLFKKLKEINDARGRKGTDKAVQIQHCEILLSIAINVYQKARCYLTLIAVRYDTALSSSYLPIAIWKTVVKDLNSFFQLLQENETLVLVDDLDEDVEEAASEAKLKKGEKLQLKGSLIALLDRLDDEFTKSLQHIDPHTTEYVERLRDETALYALVVRGQKFYQALDQSEKADHLMMRRVEHLYYKPDVVIRSVETAVLEMYPQLVEKLEKPEALVEQLCVQLYRTAQGRIRTHALLCHVYHLALHDNFQKSRNLILMSHIQDTISQTDILTQILYNRTMAQIGLCAFRCSLVKEAAFILQDLQSSIKVKELLAQGVQMRYMDKTPEQERLEKQRQLPFHTHINLELLECVYLTCAMLLEVPIMATNAHDSRRRMVSKQFRRMLDYNEKQAFTGPPENTREHIMGAAHALAAGEWERCRDLIHAIKIWDLMPASDKIKEMLTGKIQEEALRTYLLTYSPFHQFIGLDEMSSMFDLPLTRVSSIVSKMIVAEEFRASLDRATQTIVIHHATPGTEVTRLQYMAGSYAETAAQFVESNERLLESRSVALGLQQRDQQRDNNRRDGRGGYRGGTGRGRSNFQGNKDKSVRGVMKGPQMRAGR